LLRLKLPTLVERRERGDLIAVYRALKGVDKVDREDLFVWDQRYKRSWEKVDKDHLQEGHKKCSFPYRNTEI